MVKPGAPGPTVLIAFSLLLVACTGSSATGKTNDASIAPSTVASRVDDGQVLEIKTGDYFFRPNEITVYTGSITVNLTNDGPRRHSFHVRNLADTDDIVQSDDRLVAGEQETIAFTLPEPGRYRLYCAIPGHAERGEVGYFIAS